MGKKILLILWFNLLLLAGHAQNNVDNHYYQCPPDSSFVSDQPVFIVAEKQPQFPDGHKEMMNFIYKNVKYSKDDLRQKVVYIEFVIDTTGQVRKPCILNVVNRELSPIEQEVLRVVKLLPAWIPGVQTRRKVPVRMGFPIRF